MKKYVKPELFYERFELSQHIADCDWELTNATKQSCFAVADEDLPFTQTLFASSANLCDWIPTEFGGTYEGICYHDGTDGGNVFNS